MGDGAEGALPGAARSAAEAERSGVEARFKDGAEGALPGVARSAAEAERSGVEARFKDGAEPGALSGAARSAAEVSAAESKQDLRTVPKGRFLAPRAALPRRSAAES